MFDKIFIENSVTDLRTLHKVQKVFPNTPVIHIDDHEEISPYLDHTNEATLVDSGKKMLLLNNYRGDIIKYCPAKSPECYRCCNLHTINLMANCIFNCSYCILQNCLTNPVMQVHCNLDEIFDELKKHDQMTNEPMRICTGEIADSLALDHIFGHAEMLVELFGGFKNLWLELKTKSCNVSTLLGKKHNQKTIVSFSINPPSLINGLEKGTASLEQRLEAAEKLIAEGYYVCFNIDPMIHVKTWKQEYKELIHTLSNRFDTKQIAWIHVGIIRFVGNLAQIGRQRFPELKLFDEEFVLGPDRKYRYPRPLRDEMYSFMLNLIKEWDKDLTTFSCTEQGSHWKKHYGWDPVTAEEVNRHVMRKIIGESGN